MIKSTLTTRCRNTHGVTQLIEDIYLRLNLSESLLRHGIALRTITQRCEKLKIDRWVVASVSSRTISLTVDKSNLSEIEIVTSRATVKAPARQDFTKTAKIAPEKMLHGMMERSNHYKARNINTNTTEIPPANTILRNCCLCDSGLDFSAVMPYYPPIVYCALT